MGDAEPSAALLQKEPMLHEFQSLGVVFHIIASIKSKCPNLKIQLLKSIRVSSVYGHLLIIATSN